MRRGAREPWKPSQREVAAAAGKTIRDVIAVELQVLFCGINPSLYSAAVGHHFARPGNRFWPALHAGGFTSSILSPFEDRLLLAQGCGLTNLVARATASADQLTADELIEGGRRLLRTVRRYRPRCVAFLGIGAYRQAFGHKQARLGRQRDKIADASSWVLPNPSGLNAHYSLGSLGRLFAELRAGVG